MIEVFKTSVNDQLAAQMLLSDLNGQFPKTKINFDLDDCDHILRVEMTENIATAIKAVMVSKGFICEEL